MNLGLRWDALNSAGRRTADLTYQQFWRKMGTSESTLQRLGMGEQSVTPTLEHICNRLKCRVSQILGED